MLTWGSKHSLWRSLNGGARWERVYSSALANVDSIKRVEISPQYGNGSQVVFITGKSGGNPAIWNSTDNGQNFSPPRVTRDPITGTTFSINTWAVVDDDTLFVGSYNGSNGLVYHGIDSGWWYSAGAVAGNQPLYSIALSPNYNQDESILVGNIDGWVYWSSDNGTSFELLGQQLPELIANSGSNSITVAFDPEYSHNNTVYAASHCHKTGVAISDSSAIYRFIINKSTEWESIDGTLPTGGIIGQLRLSANDTLYAINSQPVDAANKEGGMERCLNPKYPLGPTFETVTRGLADGAALSGLWLYEHRLWSIDTTNTRLMTYTDSLTLPVNLTSPLDRTSGVGTGNINLDWEALKGTTSYQWQLDYDTDFSNPYEGFEGNTEVVPARLPAFKLATTYYWRVRATEPVLSPWSAKWSFTTSLGYSVIAPTFISPEAGVSGVGLKPIFQWSAIAGADSYELLVATDISFANPIIIKIGDYALSTTAWRCDINLGYDTTYYWKVRAAGSGTSSAWSAISAFATESPPAQSEPSPAQGSSSLVEESSSSSPAPSQPDTPDWVRYLTGLMGFIIILLLITILVLVVRRR